MLKMFIKINRTLTDNITFIINHDTFYLKVSFYQYYYIYYCPYYCNLSFIIIIIITIIIYYCSFTLLLLLLLVHLPRKIKILQGVHGICLRTTVQSPVPLESLAIIRKVARIKAELNLLSESKINSVIILYNIITIVTKNLSQGTIK